MRKITLIILVVAASACKTPTEKWLSGLAGFRELHNDKLSLQALKMEPLEGDSAELAYRVRVYPPKGWLENHTQDAATRFFYGADSAFRVKCGRDTLSPQLVQPVANGLKDCFEYLVSIDVTPAVKMKSLSIIYRDRIIDSADYTLNLADNN